MNINENTPIYFETRENYIKIEQNIREKEKNQFLLYSNDINQENKYQLITYQLTTGTSYFLCVDKKITLLESIKILKDKYHSFKDVIVKCILYQAKKLNENDKFENLNIAFPIMLKV